jgi:sugar phosphate isomerase/epimerase
MCRGMMAAAVVAVCVQICFCAGADGGGAGWRQDRFLITFWCPPPATDEVLAQVAAEGYNLTWVGEDGLDAAGRHGLRAMLTSGLLNPAALDDAGRRAELDALIDRVKGHAAMEAYYIVDEPGADAFAGLGRLAAYLRERDPKHLAYINLFPTYANEQQLGVTAAEAVRAREGYPGHLAGVGPEDVVVLRYREHLLRFVETVKPDLISYDHYHFFLAGDGPQYFLNMALIREAAIASGKPWLNIIQASTLEKVWRLPNAAEMRWLVFTTMAYGGRGISYFTYWGPESYGGLYQDGKAAPLAGVVAGLNAEIARFGGELMKLDSAGVYHTGALPYGTEAVPADSPVQVAGEGEFVLGLFGEGKVAAAFMIVNRSYGQSAEAVVKVKRGGGRLEELDRASGRWIKGPAADADGGVRVGLGAGDGRLFRVR